MSQPAEIFMMQLQSIEEAIDDTLEFISKNNLAEEHIEGLRYSRDLFKQLQQIPSLNLIDAQQKWEDYRNNNPYR